MSDDLVPLDKVVLERLRFMMAERVNRNVWEDVQVHTGLDWLYEDMLIRFEKEVLGEKVGHHEHDVRIGFPATVWQHFKSNHMPEWFTRRWPVRFADHTVRLHLDVLASFPEAKIKTPPRIRGSIVTPVYRVSGEERISE